MWIRFCRASSTFLLIVAFAFATRFCRASSTFLLIVAFAFAGCGLTNVQKVKLACAESAEGLAVAYRVTTYVESSKRDEVLRGIRAADEARGALCSETLYHAVEGGTADVPRLVGQIVSITLGVAAAIAPYVGGR